jgi:hypothetical protein
MLVKASALMIVLGTLLIAIGSVQRSWTMYELGQAAFVASVLVGALPAIVIAILHRRAMKRFPHARIARQ